MPGPDFPTGGLLIGKQAARAALARGRGSILMRASATIEEIRKDREAIIVTEIPYQVNKARMQETIADLVREKRIEGIADIRDESDRHGMRVVIELKRDASSEVVLNQLYRYSELQTSFGVNMLALNDGRPELMNLKALIGAFVAFREEVVTKRHALRAHQGARPRPYPGRPCRRRRQYRRSHRADPRRTGCRHGARAADGTRLAGTRRGAAGGC